MSHIHNIKLIHNSGPDKKHYIRLICSFGVQTLTNKKLKASNKKQKVTYIQYKFITLQKTLYSLMHQSFNVQTITNKNSETFDKTTYTLLLLLHQ